MIPNIQDATDYEGWTNYPTFAVSIYLNNNQSLQAQLDRIVTSPHTHLIELCDQLEQFMGNESERLGADELDVFSSLMLHALCMVNWREIIELRQRQLKENE